MKYQNKKSTITLKCEQFVLFEKFLKEQPTHGDAWLPNDREKTLTARFHDGTEAVVRIYSPEYVRGGDNTCGLELVLYDDKNQLWSGVPNSLEDSYTLEATNGETYVLKLLVELGEVTVPPSIARELLEQRAQKRERDVKANFEATERSMWSFLLWNLRKYADQNRHGYRVSMNGEEIICPSGESAETIANLLEDMGFDVVHTNYYDPEEDARNGEADEDTGYWSVYPD